MPLLYLYSQGKRARDRRCIEETPIYDTSTCLQPLSNNTHPFILLEVGEEKVSISIVEGNSKQKNS